MSEIDTSAEAVERIAKNIEHRDAVAAAINGSLEQKSAAADLIRALAAERDALRERVEKAEAENDRLMRLLRIVEGQARAAANASQAIVDDLTSRRNEGDDDGN